MPSQRTSQTAAKKPRFPREVSAYLEKLEAEERAHLESLFQITLIQSQTLDIIDLWELGDLAVSFWILLSTGVNQEEEMEIARTLLLWKAFFAQDSALVRCIQTSEKKSFGCCCARFGVVNCPSIVVGDSPEMDSFLKVEPELLFALAERPGRLQRFLTRLHQLIESGQSIESVSGRLQQPTFWSALNFMFDDIKHFLSTGAATERPLFAYHHYDNSTHIGGAMNIEGGIHGSNVAIGGSSVSHSSATYTTGADLADALNAVKPLLREFTQGQQKVLAIALDSLVSSAESDSLNLSDATANARKLADASSTLKDKLVAIVSQAGVSLATSTIVKGIKAAIGMTSE